MRKRILITFMIIFCISGCGEKSSLNSKHQELIDIISKDDFSLNDAQRAWDMYENGLFYSVAFCEEKLMKQCLFAFADLNQRIKSKPLKTRSDFKRLQTAFFEFLNCVKKFKVTDPDRIQLAWGAIEKVYANVLTTLFYNNGEFFEEELFKELEKDSPEFPTYLRTYFYYKHKNEFSYVAYGALPLYIHETNVYQTNNKDIKLLVMHDSSCQSEIIFITYNKTTHKFAQISTPKDLYFCNHSPHDHYSWDSQRNIFTSWQEGICSNYFLNLENLKLTKK